MHAQNTNKIVERHAQHEPDWLKAGRPNRLKKSIAELVEESRLNKVTVGSTNRPNRAVRLKHSTRNIMFRYCQSSFMSIKVKLVLVLA